MKKSKVGFVVVWAFLFGIVANCFAWTDVSSPEMYNQTLYSARPELAQYPVEQPNFQTPDVNIPDNSVTPNDMDDMNNRFDANMEHDRELNDAVHNQVNSVHHNVIIYRDKYGNRRALIMNTGTTDVGYLRDIN